MADLQLPCNGRCVGFAKCVEMRDEPRLGFTVRETEGGFQSCMQPIFPRRFGQDFPCQGQTFYGQSAPLDFGLWIPP